MMGAASRFPTTKAVRLSRVYNTLVKVMSRHSPQARR